ncbi:cytochrome b561 domain-containing protein 2 [Ostrinia furnacalis]|uniref:cytochrome b561 domain-containing protein 2 n=1 Tax=Ostrinia furnacalis TaxID=93504 RepID=UPI001038C8AF|nr:cytochrome b561 domain-containing protein 2 [Ostrinia furnacalis]
MPPADGDSETSRLVSSSSAQKPSYLNLISNLCGLIILGIITYCCFKKEVTLFSFHPTLMTLGWIFLMTTAVNAITPGDLATEWMPIRLRSARHWVLQAIGGIIITIGFLVILIHKIKIDKPHFTSLHGKFGLASLIFMMATMLGGIGALYSLKLKYYLAPIYTKVLHASIGLVTFTLGIVTICLGLFSDWWMKVGDNISKYVALCLVLLVMLFTILRPSLKIFFRVKERLNVN